MRQKYNFLLEKTVEIMTKVYEFLATGFEEVEALAPVDVLRRAGIDVKTVSITGEHTVTGAHGVGIVADALIEEVTDWDEATLLILPGGMPGATNLRDHEGVRSAVSAQVAAGRDVAAICAAPLVLGSVGVLEGKKATCYPGFENHLTGATYTAELVTVDGNIITGAGPAAALPFAYTLLSRIKGEATADTIQRQMLVKDYPSA